MAQEGFSVWRPKALKPTLCGGSGPAHLKTLLDEAETSLVARIDGQSELMAALDDATADLRDPLNPPQRQRGRFFEPLDSGLLGQGELSHYLVENETGVFGFATLQEKVTQGPSEEAQDIGDLCLERRMEAVRPVGDL